MSFNLKQQAVEFSEPMIQQSGPAAGHVMPVPPPVSQGTSDQMVRPQHNPVTLTSDWIVHIRKRDGRRFYYNIKTRESTWHKPYELMTLNERADSTTNWREVTTELDGTDQKYYYNEVTKKSTWTMPQEIQVARSKFIAESSKGAEAQSDIHVAGDVKNEVKSSAQENKAPASGSTGVHVPLNDAADQMSVFDEFSLKDAEIALCGEGEGAPIEKTDNAPETVKTATTTIVEQKIVEEDTENAQDAKTDFRALLESVNVRSDSTWNQAMKLIINDKRYAALTPHAKRTKTFDEFVKEKKKQEAAERRAKHKTARENFRKMLKESKELTASTRWRKAIAIFEHDERFLAVERAKDREDMLQAYREELQAKESKLRKQKPEIYLEYLKSCDFIKSTSIWSNVQHRLEADKRCSSLHISERFDIFQDYLYDLKKDEEVQRKLRMKETQKAERKNRQEFRKLMEDKIAARKLHAKTCWNDFYMEVKDSSAYKAVSSNKSGATTKDLFKLVVDDLQQKYMEDRSKITLAEKSGKFTMSSRWMLKDFKAVVLANFSCGEIAENNLKMIYEELKLRKEKEEERRRYVVHDFYKFLRGLKEITPCSTWEECNSLFEDRFREKSILRETFHDYVLELKEKDREEKKRSRREMKKIKKEEAKTEKEHRRKEKEKKKEKKRKEDTSVRKKHKKQSRKDSTNKKRQWSSTDMCYGDDDETKPYKHKRHNIHGREHI